MFPEMESNPVLKRGMYWYLVVSGSLLIDNRNYMGMGPTAGTVAAHLSLSTLDLGRSQRAPRTRIDPATSNNLQCNNNLPSEDEAKQLAPIPACGKKNQISSFGWGSFQY